MTVGLIESEDGPEARASEGISWLKVKRSSTAYSTTGCFSCECCRRFMHEVSKCLNLLWRCLQLSCHPGNTRNGMFPGFRLPLEPHGARRSPINTYGGPQRDVQRREICSLSLRTLALREVDPELQFFMIDVIFGRHFFVSTYHLPPKGFEVFVQLIMAGLRGGLDVANDRLGRPRCALLGQRQDSRLVVRRLNGPLSIDSNATTSIRKGLHAICGVASRAVVGDLLFRGQLVRDGPMPRAEFGCRIRRAQGHAELTG